MPSTNTSRKGASTMMKTQIISNDDDDDDDDNNDGEFTVYIHLYNATATAFYVQALQLFVGTKDRDAGHEGHRRTGGPAKS